MRCATSIVTSVALLVSMAHSAAVAQQASFGEEATVVAVEIPVQVLVGSEPVRGLTRESFEVFEGRKGRAIVDFEVVDLEVARAASGRPTAAVEEPPTASGRRHFLILFDLTNSNAAAIIRARGAAAKMVEGSLHPSDLVGVATWSYKTGPRLILGFTTDRRQIDVAITNLGVVDLHNRSSDTLGLQLADLQRQSSDAGGGSANRGGIDKDAEVLEALKENAAIERAAARSAKSAEIDALTQGFGTLAQVMNAVAGRKYVVLMSQGFDSSLITGTSDASTEADTAASVESGEIWNVNSEERFGSTRTANQLSQMLTTFRRSDCIIQAVDIGGLAVGGEAGEGRRASGRDTLLTMAKDTGGQYYENFNDLGQAMGSMLQATSVTYVLTIQPEDLKLDGKFHELKVRLKDGGPSGARLVHRPGYFAPKPYATRAGLEKQIDTAQLVVSGEPGGDLVAGVAAAAFRGEGDRMHVPVVVEVDGPVLLLAKKGDALPLSIYVYAFDAAGSVADFVAQSLQLDLKQVGGRLAKEPLKFVGDLRLPPGSYALRTLVRAGDGGAYWLGSRPLEVPAFAPGTLAAVTPLVPEPMTAGLVIRSASSVERTQGLAFPFMRTEGAFLPKGLPILRKGGELPACLNIYGLDNSDVAVRGELVDDDGRTVPDAEVKLLSRSASDQPGLQRLELSVRPGSAGAGPYTLRVTVEQTGRSASAWAPVSVGS